MALRDGVLLQSERFWAAAVRSADGGVRVSSAAKARLPGRESLQRIPVVRGLVLNQGEAHEAVAGVSEADARADRHLGFVEQQLAEFERAEVAVKLRDGRPDEHRAPWLVHRPADAGEAVAEHVAPPPVD